jgi:hypothetical protein
MDAYRHNDDFGNGLDEIHESLRLVSLRKRMYHVGVIETAKLHRGIEVPHVLI